MALLTCASTSFGAFFSVTATDVAPAAILENQRREILRLAVGNPAVGGPATARLSTFGLRMVQSSGTGLGTLDGSNLFSSIAVYVDSNASGAFEPAADKFVSALFSPNIASDGGLSFDLSTSEPTDAQIPSGSTRNYFLVLHVAPTAAAASPNAFRITHVAEGSGASTAVDAVSGTLLTLASAVNVSSKLVTATVNQPPTTTGIADVVAFDNSGQGMVALHSSFQDAEDAPGQLSYSLIQNSNPGLFGFAGIETGTGKLLLTYAPGSTGLSQLTVKATDTLGKSVSASFHVRVIPFVTYSDFQLVHPATGNPLERTLANGQTNLHSYAFFLNQGLLGLPRLQANGNARIFTHLRPKQISDVFYNYQLSQDLQTWVPAVKNVDYYENTKDLGDGSVRVELLLLNGWQKAFMKIQTQLVSHAAPPVVPPAGDGEPAGLSGGQSPGLPPPPVSPGVSIVSSAVFPSQTVLSNTQAFASSVYVIDMDNDGFKDVIAASQNDDKVAWYRNEQNGNFGPARIVTTQADGAICVRAADLNNDGLVDAVSSSLNDGTVAWYQRNADGSFGPKKLLASAAQFPTTVEIADLDNDGKPDVLWTSWLGNKISWSRNLGGGSFASAQTIVDQSVSPWIVVAVDLDGDGVRDIATASVNNHSVEWYKGNGNGTFGARRLLTAWNDQEVQSPLSLSAADIDGDGMIDLVAAYAAMQKIVWFRNTGNSTFAPRQVITNQVQDSFSVFATDLNGDGKVDILSTSATDGRVVWFQNQGAGNFGNPDANRLIIANGVPGAYSVGAGDFNQDGLLDVVSASQDDSKVAVYINRGGQTGLSTSDIAPPVILDGEKRAVLRIQVSNRGQAGNNNARLDSVSLLLESNQGVPLTSAQANALIDSLYIFADIDDNQVFEADIDSPVAVVPHLSLNAGRLTAPVRGNALAVQIAPGTTRSYFVVPHLTANAASQTPNAFRLTHYTQGPGRSTASDAFSGASLTVEASPVSSVISSVTAAQTNTSPTTIGLPNITVNDTVAPSFVSVHSYFSDTEDGTAGLRYEVAGNTNAGLFSFVGINTSGSLVIRYRPGNAGSANITVQAIDSLGKSVSSTFAVTVALANTFSNWSGGGGAGNQSGLVRYAFGLSPQSGDVAGLPRFRVQGKAKVVSHRKPAWATDLSYQYEISQDMSTWIPAVPGVHFHEFTKDLPNALRQSDLVLLVNWPKAFVRARAALTN